MGNPVTKGRAINSAVVLTPTHRYRQARAEMMPDNIKVLDRRTHEVLAEANGELQGGVVSNTWTFVTEDGTEWSVTKTCGCQGKTTIVEPL